MFGLGNGLGALPSNAGVGLTPEDAQALGIDTQQAETQAAQSPLGSFKSRATHLVGAKIG